MRCTLERFPFDEGELGIGRAPVDVAWLSTSTRVSMVLKYFPGVRVS